MEALDDQAVLEHYRSVADPLFRHVAGRPVFAAGWGASGSERYRSVDELLETVAGGCRWFAVPVGALAPRAVVRLAPGPGADSATAAMVALNLFRIEGAEHTVTLTDGDQGLILFLDIDGPAAAAALRELAERAPEIATLDPVQDDGRVLLVLADPDDRVPVPYSLVDQADGTGIVLPLHADEVAAAAAGMPLDHEPDDAASRLAARGDLAVALAGPAGTLPPAG